MYGSNFLSYGSGASVRGLFGPGTAYYPNYGFGYPYYGYYGYPYGGYPYGGYPYGGYGGYPYGGY